jgi:ferrochelatase
VTTDHDYDALLVVSFGGPEGPADVDSFLDNVFRGLRVPPETKEHIAKRYEQVGGVSPINAHTRAFIKALQLELDAHGPALPIYWGNRNWHPLLADTVAQMAHAGVRRALAFVTSTSARTAAAGAIARTCSKPRVCYRMRHCSTSYESRTTTPASSQR